MKAGQQVRLQLDCDETIKLYTALHDLFAIGPGGITYGVQNLAVLRTSDTSVAIEELQAVIQWLIQQDSARMINIIDKLQPNLLESVAFAKLYQCRRTSLETFEEQLNKKVWSEGEWEHYFRKNTWIFGHGLAYQFLSEVQGQPNYGGTTVSGTGMQRGDYLMASEAKARFTVLVEIKKPNSDLVTNKLYRNKVYELGGDLSGGVSQLQSNCRTWALEGARQEQNQEDLDAQNIFTYEPKGILVIGDTSGLDNRDKRATFELFRRNLHNPEVITYDELLARARFLVSVEDTSSGQEEKTDSDIDADDIPF